MDNLTPFFSDDDFVELTLHIQDRLDQLRQLPYPQVQEVVYDLLGSIDMMHREAFARMLILIEQHLPELGTEFEQDTVIRSVLGLYEFLPTEEDGEDELVADVATFIPLGDISISPGIKKPIWIPGGNSVELPPGTMRAQTFEDVQLLLCNVDGQIYALRNACIDSILPLSSGTLEGHTLICPWHGCRYDVRNGEMQNSSGLKLETFPVKIADDGQFSVGFNIPKYAW